MTTWNQRLNQALEAKNKTASQLSRACDVSAASVNKWLSGVTSKPKYDDVMNISRFLGISSDWLMNGTGGMSTTFTSPATDMVELEQVDIKGSCGLGAINFNDVPEIKRILVTNTWFTKNFAFYNPNSIKIVTAQGDSMEPEINDGDAVFIDITDKELLRDGIYLLSVDGEIFIKRVQKLIGKKIALISSNKAYKDIEVPIDTDIEIRFIGRVIKNLKLIDI